MISLPFGTFIVVKYFGSVMCFLIALIFRFITQKFWWVTSTVHNLPFEGGGLGEMFSFLA